MANTIGGALKSTLIDAGHALKRAGQAIVDPTRLGNDGVNAWKTLRFLDNFTQLLPTTLQPLAKALLGVGIENVGRHGDPVAKEAVRGFAASMAVKEGRVSPEVIERAVGKEQKAALYKASKEGDLATVKSILRHNKKVAAQEKHAKPDIVKPDPSGVMTSRTGGGEVKIDASTKGFGPSVADMAVKLAEARVTSNKTGGLDIKMVDGKAIKFELVWPKNPGAPLQVKGERDGKPLSKDEMNQLSALVRDAALLNAQGAKNPGAQDVMNFVAKEMGRMRQTLGSFDATDKKVEVDDRARFEERMKDPRAGLTDAEGNQYRWDLKKKQAVRIENGADVKLSSRELSELLRKLERQIEEMKARLAQQRAEGENPTGLAEHIGNMTKDLGGLRALAGAMPKG